MKQNDFRVDPYYSSDCQNLESFKPKAYFFIAVEIDLAKKKTNWNRNLLFLFM